MKENQKGPHTKVTKEHDGGGFDTDAWVPKTQSNFRLDQVADFLSVTVNHVFDLVSEGALKVPRENISRAPSRASILIPRASIVSFVRRRCSLSPERRRKAARRAERAQRGRNLAAAGKRACKGFAMAKGGTP